MNSQSLCFPKTILRGYRTAYIYTDSDKGNNAIRSYENLSEEEKESLINLIKESTALDSNLGNFDDFKAPIAKSGEELVPLSYENTEENTKQFWGELAEPQKKRLQNDIPEDDYAALKHPDKEEDPLKQTFEIGKVNTPHGFDSPLQMILDNNSVNRIKKIWSMRSLLRKP
tara:strand:+ start:119920 stop:120432 length:513 start_codon:yes stop_codon:yes gene_type:complete